MSLPTEIKPEAFYDIKLDRKLVINGVVLRCDSLINVSGKFLAVILEANEDAVVEAVEV